MKDDADKTSCIRAGAEVPSINLLDCKRGGCCAEAGSETNEGL